MIFPGVLAPDSFREIVLLRIIFSLGPLLHRCFESWHEMAMKRRFLLTERPALAVFAAEGAVGFGTVHDFHSYGIELDRLIE